MDYITIKGHRLSRLTLGTVALGMDYGVSNTTGRPEESEGRRILSLAAESGITAIDTARNYGGAEDLVGRYLGDQHGRLPFTVISKFKLSAAAADDLQQARAEAYASVRASCRALRLERLPVCLFHMDRKLPARKVDHILQQLFGELLEDGLIGMAGVSVDHPDELDVFLNNPLVEAVQVPMNVFDLRTLEKDSLKRMHEEKRLVFVRSVFLQGLLFMQPEQLPANVRQAQQYLEALHALAAETGMSVAQLAVSFVRDLHGVSSLVFGAVNTTQIAQNVELMKAPPLDSAVKEKIFSLFRHVPEQVITPGMWTM